MRLHKRISRRLDVLDAAVAPDDINLHGFSFHALRGHKTTRYSVHINGPWCITFEFHDGNARSVSLEQYHWEAILTRNPDRCPTHPGELLREDLIPATRQSKTEIARMLGISRQHLCHILAERKPVTAGTAVRLAKLFGNASLVWIRMQGEHDAWHAARRVDVSDIPTLGEDGHKLIPRT